MPSARTTTRRSQRDRQAPSIFSPSSYNVAAVKSKKQPCAQQQQEEGSGGADNTSSKNNKENNNTRKAVVKPPRAMSTTAGQPTNNEMAGDAHTTSSSSSSSPSLFLLGLKRADDDDNSSTIIPLRPQSILGRTTKKTLPHHVDLGLTTANAKHISKEACVVESVSETELVLRIPHDVFAGEKKYYKPFVVRNNKNNNNNYNNNTAAAPELVNSERVVLHPGDIFIFQTGKDYPNHPFQVVPVNMPVNRAQQAAKALEGRRTNHRSQEQEQEKVPVASADPTAAAEAEAATTTTTTTPRRNKRVARKALASPASKRLSVDITVAATPVPKEKEERNKQRFFFCKDKTTAPYDIPWDCWDHSLAAAAIAVQAVPANDNNGAGVDHSWRATTLKPRLETSSQDDDDDVDRDDDDDDDDDEAAVPAFFRVRDMHVTLANTYWKALHTSDTPGMGSSLLHALLADQRLPPPKLCQDLVQLVTFGCFKGNSNNNINNKAGARASARESVPRWDPNRLQLASQYIYQVLSQYPNMAYDRFGEAAGSDYWMNVLEQLYTLPYYDADEKKSKKKESTKDDALSSSSFLIESSLQLHVFALQLFHRLVHGMIHRPCTDSPVIRDMEEYGGKAACRLAANATAHIWVEFGSHLFAASSSTTTTTMSSVVLELTNVLGSIMVLLLDKFVLSAGDNKTIMMKEAVEILWNALDGKISNVVADSEQQSKKKNNSNKEWLRNLKLLWIESFGRDDLEEALAKRLRLFQEYKSIGPV